MKEELITYDTAVLAKEKGFDIGGYLQDKWLGTNSKGENVMGLGATSKRPTQSLLQRWLREVHEIDVVIFREGAIHSKREGWSADVATTGKHHIFKWDLGNTHKTYEQALEQGLQEALKLIKK